MITLKVCSHWTLLRACSAAAVRRRLRRKRVGLEIFIFSIQGIFRIYKKSLSSSPDNWDPMSENYCNWKSNAHVSTLATALFSINVIFIFVFALISISIFVFVCVLYLYLRSESHLCQWCQLRQLEYHNSPRGLVWGDWYDFGGSNIWKKFDDWMILEENIFGTHLVIE